MADKIELEIVITPEGEVRMATHGLKGATCVAEVDAVAKVVGRVRMRSKTREAYEQIVTGKNTVKTR